MNKKLSKQQKGFTIIEVLIVLAIAGLIMLIVFLAVPALQRNSRNNQRRNDVSRILAATNEAAMNNNWNLAGANILGVLGQAQQNMGDLSIYQDKNFSTGNLRLAAAGASANANINIATVVLNASCTEDNVTQQQNRSVAVLYRVETGGGEQVQCENS